MVHVSGILMFAWWVVDVILPSFPLSISVFAFLIAG